MAYRTSGKRRPKWMARKQEEVTGRGVQCSEQRRERKCGMISGEKRRNRREKSQVGSISPLAAACLGF